MSTDKYVNLIRKLLAMAASNSPHEAEIAQRRAELLMKKYDITYDQVGMTKMGNKEFISSYNERIPQLFTLYSTIGRCLGLQVIRRQIWTHVQRKNQVNPVAVQKVSYTVYGPEHRLDIALYLFEALQTDIRVTYRAHVNETGVKDNNVSRRHFTAMYCQQATRKVYKALEGLAIEHVEEIQKEHEQSVAYCTDLIGNVKQARTAKRIVMNESTYNAAIKAGNAAPINLGIQ